MKIIVNADDFANSLNMSEIICQCFDGGSLNSTSIMINAKNIDKSIEKLEKRKGIRTSLHLNIAEGNPLSKELAGGYLVDNKNLFCKSFETILLGYYFGNSSKKSLIKQEIKQEIKNQILLYVKKLKTNCINIDSHQYYHTIPFISDILMELRQELDVTFSYIRVPREPFFISINSLGDFKNYFGSNIIKHLLLNFLSIILIKKLKKNKIKYNDIFIGVLFTGNMTFQSIKKALKNSKKGKTVEILLHPGYLSCEETENFADDVFKDFYTNKNRKREMKILLSKQFKNLIKGKEDE